MTRPMQILVPLDGSKFGEQALPYVFEIAQRAHALLHFVHVVPGLMTRPEEIVFLEREVDSAEWRASEEYLAERVRGMPDGLNARTMTLAGPVVPALAAYIARAGIDLAVMTTHGRSGLTRVLLGSVADALIRAVHIPILLLHPDGRHATAAARQLQHVLVPLDGSEIAEEALAPAIALGWLSAARYTLVQVVEPVMAETYAAAVSTQVSPHEAEHIRELAREYLENIAERLRARGLTVDTLVLEAQSADVGILHAARTRDADMIAMVTHGWQGWKRFTFGSVAGDVLHHTHLPFLVLRGTRVAARTFAELSAV